MASIVILSGVVGYYLYKENKIKKQNKKNGVTPIPTNEIREVSPREEKVRRFNGSQQQLMEIPPTYQNAIISPPSLETDTEYTHELGYQASPNSLKATPSLPSEANKNKALPKYKRGSEDHFRLFKRSNTPQ